MHNAKRTLAWTVVAGLLAFLALAPAPGPTKPAGLNGIVASAQ